MKRKSELWWESGVHKPPQPGNVREVDKEGMEVLLELLWGLGKGGRGLERNGQAWSFGEPLEGGQGWGS